MPRHLLTEHGYPNITGELTPDEASTRWERQRIMPCENCTEQAAGIMNEDVIVYHECD